MAQRCFDSFNVVLSASERSSKKRNTTIYTEIQKNVQQLHTANPIKQNGFYYNKNSVINPTCDISSGLVEVAKSYELLADIKEGCSIIYPNQVSTPKYESWSGNLFSANYVKYGIGNVVQTDLSLNNVIDPSNLLFYDKCFFIYNENRPESWIRIVDLSFQNTYFSRDANNTIGC